MHSAYLPRPRNRWSAGLGGLGDRRGGGLLDRCTAHDEVVDRIWGTCDWGYNGEAWLLDSWTDGSWLGRVPWWAEDGEWVETV